MGCRTRTAARVAARLSPRMSPEDTKLVHATTCRQVSHLLLAYELRRKQTVQLHTEAAPARIPCRCQHKSFRPRKQKELAPERGSPASSFESPAPSFERRVSRVSTLKLGLKFSNRLCRNTS